MITQCLLQFLKVWISSTILCIKFSFELWLCLRVQALRETCVSRKRTAYGFQADCDGHNGMNDAGNLHWLIPWPQYDIETDHSKFTELGTSVAHFPAVRNRVQRGTGTCMYTIVRSLGRKNKGIYSFDLVLVIISKLLKFGFPSAEHVASGCTYSEWVVRTVPYEIERKIYSTFF